MRRKEEFYCERYKHVYVGLALSALTGSSLRNLRSKAVVTRLRVDASRRAIVKSW